MNTLLKFLMICGLSITSLGIHQAKADILDADQALNKLQTLEENLEVLAVYAERVDLGRILVIEKQDKNLVEIIKAKGLGNLQVLNGYQQLVFSLKYSQAFLNSMRANGNAASIVAIQTITDEIIKDCGFEDQVVSQLVAGIMNQMHNINVQIRNQEVSSELSRWLQGDFDRAVGNALAAARANGDVPSTYEAAKAVHDLLLTKYNQLFSVGLKSNAYEMVTELIGLNEFFQEIYTRGYNGSKGVRK